MEKYTRVGIVIGLVISIIISIYLLLGFETPRELQQYSFGTVKWLYKLFIGICLIILGSVHTMYFFIFTGYLIDCWKKMTNPKRILYILLIIMGTPLVIALLLYSFIFLLLSGT